jgi:hypothetical protein
MGLSKVIRCRPTRPNGPHGRGVQGHIGNVRGASGEFLDVNGRAEYVKRACEARSLDCVDEVAQFQPVPADQLFKKRSKSG